MVGSNKLREVRCPGCFSRMELHHTSRCVDSPFMAYMTCACGWESPTVFGESEEDAIEKAIRIASRRDMAVLVKRWGEKEEDGNEDSARV